jgi:hypothetical protein
MYYKLSITSSNIEDFSYYSYIWKWLSRKRRSSRSVEKHRGMTSYYKESITMEAYKRVPTVSF